MTIRFRSKVDALLMVPLAFGASVPALLATRNAISGGPVLASVIMPLLIVTLISWLLVISYAVTDDEVIVYRGPFRSRLPLDRITTLRATRQVWSAPALSLDRIEIRTDRGAWLVVSPADKAGFIAAIRARVPDVHLEGFR